MRRGLAIVVTAATVAVLAAGCGGKRYEVRLDKTLEEMRYRKRLDDNLTPPAKGKLETNLIYVRPPKGLEGPTKVFQLTELEPGKFDVSESFFEKDKQNLHVLARIKRPKAAASKKGPAQPEPAKAARGEFNADVVAVLNSVYGVEIDLAKAKEESKRTNRFKRLTFEGNGKNVQLFLLGSKTSPYEVALVFEYPKSEQSSLISKIDLCLGSFAVGEKARRFFEGVVTEEEGTEPGAATGPAPM